MFEPHKDYCASQRFSAGRVPPAAGANTPPPDDSDNPQGGVYSQPPPAGIAAGQDLPLAGPKTQAPLAKERSRCAAHAHVIFGGTIRNADRFPRTPYDSGIGTGNRHLWKLRNTMALLDFEKSHVFVVLHQNWGIGADP